MTNNEQCFIDEDGNLQYLSWYDSDEYDLEYKGDYYNIVIFTEDGDLYFVLHESLEDLKRNSSLTNEEIQDLINNASYFYKYETV